MTRTRKKWQATAIIVDKTGTELYTIVPTIYARLLTAGYVVLLLIAILFTYLLYSNKQDINQLKKEVKVDEIQEDISQ